MAELLNVGTSSLLAYQKALATTGHNIANVNTEGYSRQSLTLDTRAPSLGAVVMSGLVLRFQPSLVPTTPF